MKLANLTWVMSAMLGCLFLAPASAMPVDRSPGVGTSLTEEIAYRPKARGRHVVRRHKARTRYVVRRTYVRGRVVVVRRPVVTYEYNESPTYYRQRRFESEDRGYRVERSRVERRSEERRVEPDGRRIDERRNDDRSRGDAGDRRDAAPRAGVVAPNRAPAAVDKPAQNGGDAGARQARPQAAPAATVAPAAPASQPASRVTPANGPRGQGGADQNGAAKSIQQRGQ